MTKLTCRSRLQHPCVAQNQYGGPGQVQRLARRRRSSSVVFMFTLPGGLALNHEAAEPVLETRRTDARVIAGGEALIVQLCAEVACVHVCGDRPCVSDCAQESSDEFVQTYRFGTRQLDCAVQRFRDCDVGQCGSDVIRHNGLQTFVRVGA